MAVKALHKNFVTPVGRASFAHVFEATEQLNGQLAFSLAVLFPKSDKEGISNIRKAIISAAKEKFGDDKAKWPKPLDNPLRDGDEKAEAGITAYADSFYINAKSKYQPGVVGSNLKPIMDAEEFYSGCYCRAQVNFYAYNKAGNKGVGVGLNNLMKVKDGDRLDDRQSAESAFGKYKTEDEDAPESSEGGESEEDEDFFE